MIPVELLAPAKDLECGRAAIDCGADALYIGAPRFGARENAGNSLDDISALTAYAHQYWARVYVTVNTLLTDREIPAALRLIGQLHEIGIDALIIQDTGLLECDLPPIPLIASTQMHNHTPERVAFLEQIGFQRAILARELSLSDIRAVRQAAPTIELECFIHGSLCVSYSGQCYMSYALGGRSGNRGQCAQPCRKCYSLIDASGKVLVKDKHLLCLRDLNLSEHLLDLLDAGITSFKIEGRLKDKSYVANIAAYYRNRLDQIFAENPGKWRPAASGASRVEFSPNPDKTFNRGYSTYFLQERSQHIAATDSPKMIGEFIATVVSAQNGRITLDADNDLHPGDGICFFNDEQQLAGTLVNIVDGRVILPLKTDGLRRGIRIYRNHDHAFLKTVEKSRNERRIHLTFQLFAEGQNLALEARDEDGITAAAIAQGPFAPAEQPDRAIQNIARQLGKTGGSLFACDAVQINVDPPPFLPISAINALRRDVLDKLLSAREAQRPRKHGGILQNDVPYPEKKLDYHGNVINAFAEQFFRRHGVEQIDPGAETGMDLIGCRVMTTKFCIKHQLGWCPRLSRNAAPAGPLFLIADDGFPFELEFDCAACQMHLYLERKKT